MICDHISKINSKTTIHDILQEPHLKVAETQT